MAQHIQHSLSVTFGFYFAPIRPPQQHKTHVLLCLNKLFSLFLSIRRILGFLACDFSFRRNDRKNFSPKNLLIIALWIESGEQVFVPSNRLCFTIVEIRSNCMFFRESTSMFSVDCTRPLSGVTCSLANSNLFKSNCEQLFVLNAPSTCLL